MSKDREELIEVARAAVEEIRRQDLLRHFPRADETWVRERSRQGSEHFATEFQAALSAIEGAGFVVLPREPTEAMNHAGATDQSPNHATNTLDRMYGAVANIYRAMVNAYSPKPTAASDLQKLQTTPPTTEEEGA